MVINHFLSQLSISQQQVKMTDRHANLKELPHGCVLLGFELPRHGNSI